MWANWLERTLSRTHAADGRDTPADRVGHTACAADDLTPTCPPPPSVSRRVLAPNRQVRLTPMAGAAAVCT